MFCVSGWIGVCSVSAVDCLRAIIVLFKNEDVSGVLFSTILRVFFLAVLHIKVLVSTDLGAESWTRVIMTSLSNVLYGCAPFLGGWWHQLSIDIANTSFPHKQGFN